MDTKEGIMVNRQGVALPAIYCPLYVIIPCLQFILYKIIKLYQTRAYTKQGIIPKEKITGKKDPKEKIIPTRDKQGVLFVFKPFPGRSFCLV